MSLRKLGFVIAQYATVLYIYPLETAETAHIPTQKSAREPEFTGLSGCKRPQEICWMLFTKDFWPFHNEKTMKISGRLAGAASPVQHEATAEPGVPKMTRWMSKMPGKYRSNKRSNLRLASWSTRCIQDPKHPNDPNLSILSWGPSQSVQGHWINKWP